MDLQHSGKKQKLLEFISDTYTVTLSGKLPPHLFTQMFHLHQSSSLQVLSKNEVKVYSLQSDGALRVNETSIMLPLFFEEVLYELTVVNHTGEKIEVYHDSEEIRNAFSSVANILLGSFTFKGEVGLSEFKLKQGSDIVLAFIIEVFPSKMDYMKDYQNMVRELNDELYGLIFEYFGKTFQNGALRHTPHQSHHEFLTILEVLFHRLEHAISWIGQHPRKNIANVERITKTEKAKRISKQTRSYIQKRPHYLVENHKGITMQGRTYLPVSVVSVQKITTMNTPENQFVKYLIQKTIRKLSRIEKELQKQIYENRKIFEKIVYFKKRLSYLLQTFFHEVKSINQKPQLSLVFKMSRGYKEIYYYDLLLQKGLTLGEDFYRITPKRIWKLYEMWCYLKIHQLILEHGYGMKSFQPANDGFFAQLFGEKDSVMTYENKHGHKVELWYNKHYRALPTTNQKPDIVLSIKEVNGKERIYLFDAKYRLSVDANGAIGPMEEDINVMHRYRDSIVAELKQQFQYKTFGAYVLFPFSDEAAFQSHRFYKSIEKVNIGAFPMLPGSHALLNQHLIEILGETNIEARERILLHSQLEDHFKFKHTNVLVLKIDDDQILKKTIEQRKITVQKTIFSHVRLGVEYIAFYETKSCEYSGIRYYAKIQHIKEERENYFFQFSKVATIGPIQSAEYGPASVYYTTLYLLQHAESVHELQFQSHMEVKWYKQLRKIAQQHQVMLKKRKDYYKIGPIDVQIIDSKVARVNGVLTTFEALEEAVAVFFERE